jgi:anti-sigma factor RsiW
VIDVGQDLERIRDYVAGRLSDDEHRAFEDRLARDPRLVRELELSQRLREGLERLRERDQLIVPTRREFPRHWTWAAGLEATIAVVALLLWVRPDDHQRLELMAATGPSVAPAATFTFVAMRGPSTTTVLDLPADGVVELRASRPAGPAGAHYRVVLNRVDAAGGRVTVGDRGGLESGPDGLVRVYTDAARISPGDYELRLEADHHAAAVVEVFAFRLRSAPR